MRDYPHFAAIATPQRAPSTPAGTMIAVNLGRIAWVVTVLACLVTAGILLLLACMLFGEEDHLGRILLVESPRPKKLAPRWKRDRSASSEAAS